MCIELDKVGMHQLMTTIYTDITLGLIVPVSISWFLGGYCWCENRREIKWSI